MKVEPKQLAGAPRCGARARNRGGAPCRAPCVRGKSRCRLHGGARGSGGQLGPKNGMWRGGKFSREGRALRNDLREMRRLGEAMVAKVADLHGRKPPRPLRRRVHVKRVLKPKGEQK
jgi:hypothetical protein